MMEMDKRPQTPPFLINLGKGLSVVIGLPTIVAWESDSRPKNPRPGTFGFNSQTNNLEYFDGKSWFEARMTE